MTSFALPSVSVRHIAPTPVPAETSTPVPVATDIEIDAQLVQGIRLPKIPGLPGAGTTVPSLGELKEQLAPPAPGSFAAKADMAVVKGAQLLRSEASDAWARTMNDDGTSKMWFDLAEKYRGSTGKVQGWLGTALLAGTLAANAAATGVGKQTYKRERPFVLDPSIEPPFHKPNPNTSYPSGHSSSAFAAARVISVLAPELAVEAYNLATQVATSRVYAGVHFPSDVVAGAVLGTAVAEQALKLAGKR